MTQVTNKIISLFDNKKKLFDEATPEIRKSTCQIFTNQDGKFKPHGCGVFVALEGHHFIFSVAHVFEDHNIMKWVTGKADKFVRLGGDLTLNTVPSRDQDKIDLAFMKLNQETIENLGNSYHPIYKDELGINHQVNELMYYMMLGYPASKTEYHYTKKLITMKSFEYITLPAKNEIYNSLNCKRDQNIIFNYEKEKVYNFETKQFKIGPDPYGISGAGIWHITMGVDMERIKPIKKLIAILTEWPTSNKKFWISTRIDVFTEMIREQYVLSIPKSQIIRIN